MQGHRRAVAQAKNKDALRCAQRLYHIGKLHGIQRIHPLGQVRHLLLVVSRQQGVALYGIAVFRQRHAALAQCTHLVAHLFETIIAKPFKQAADSGFRHAAQTGQFGAVVAHQVIKMIHDK
jgi:hypothetical protein